MSVLDLDEEQVGPTIFDLSVAHRRKVGEIAEAMSKELGIKVSRVAAVRRLIDQAHSSFFSPVCPADRTINDTPNS